MSSLITTNEEMEKLGIKFAKAVLDAGFFFENNIRSMSEKHTDFLIRVPANRSLYHDLIENSGDTDDLGKSVQC